MDVVPLQCTTNNELFPRAALAFARSPWASFHDPFGEKSKLRNFKKRWPSLTLRVT